MPLGPAEILVILLVALLVFGPHRLPEIGRQVGRGLREFRKFQQTCAATSTRCSADDVSDRRARTDAAPADTPAAPRRIRRRATAEPAPGADEPEPPRRRQPADDAEPHVATPRSRRPHDGRRAPRRAAAPAHHLVVAVAASAALCYCFAPDIIRFFLEYYRDATDGESDAFIFTGPLDAFVTRLKVATYGGSSSRCRCGSASSGASSRRG